MQHCRSSSSKGANSAIEQYRTLTRLHYDENSVCLSVRMSNACIVTKRKKDRLCLDFYTTSALVVIRDLPRVPIISRKRRLLVSYCWSVNPRLNFGPVAPTIRSDPLFRNTGRPDPRNEIRFAPPRRSASTRGLELSGDTMTGNK